MDDNDISNRLLRLKEVCELTGFKKSFVYKQTRFGDFPAPMKIGLKSVRWKLANVQSWINKQKSA